MPTGRRSCSAPWACCYTSAAATTRSAPAPTAGASSSCSSTRSSARSRSLAAAPTAGAPQPSLPSLPPSQLTRQLVKDQKYNLMRTVSLTTWCLCFSSFPFLRRTCSLLRAYLVNRAAARPAWWRIMRLQLTCGTRCAVQADVGAAAAALEAVQPGGLPGTAVQGAPDAQAAPADTAGGEAAAGLRQHAPGAGASSVSTARSETLSGGDVRCDGAKG